MIGVRAFTIALIALCLTPGCAHNAQAVVDPRSDERAVTLEKIAEDVWVHKSYKTIAPWGPVLSQGLVVDNGAGIYLVDTAWTNDQTTQLLSTVATTLGRPVGFAIVTHAHDDKMGGMAALHAAGVQTIALDKTNMDAPTRGLIAANQTFSSAGGEIVMNALPGVPLSQQTPVDRGAHAVGMGRDLIAYFPGAGHTRDNIVVYDPHTKILFGGCLIRPGASRSLGNTADADIHQWAASVERVKQRFPEARIVVPSHGTAGGPDLLDHTIQLANEAVAKTNDE